MNTPPTERAVPATEGVGRRVVLTAAAWGVPAISLASASPAFATSPGACEPTTTNVQVPFYNNPHPDDNESTVTLLVDVPVGDELLVYSVILTNELGNDTVVESLDFERCNMTRDNRHVTGPEYWKPQDGTETFNSDMGPGAVILNQRTGDPGNPTNLAAPAAGARDEQIVTFSVFDQLGEPVDVTNMVITIEGIDSVDTPVWPEDEDDERLPEDAWRAAYRDVVSFNPAPTSVSIGYPLPSGHPADPSVWVGDDWGGSANFSFNEFPSGSTLTFTQRDGRQGWHSVAISEISFDVAAC